MVKVVMVARNPELEDTARKRGKSHIFLVSHFHPVFFNVTIKQIACLLQLKSLLKCSRHLRLQVYTRILNIESAFGWLPLAAPQQTKRLTPPAIALRSKSMTSELEDMGKMIERTKTGTKKLIYKKRSSHRVFVWVDHDDIAVFSKLSRFVL